MSAESLLKQYSEERAALVESALPKAAAIILGRRRILSGIRWRSDLIVTAAEAIGGLEHVDVRLDGDELGAEVIATDLTTDVAILRVGTVSEDLANGGADDAIASRGSTDASLGASGGLGRRHTGASAAATSANPASASPAPLAAPSTGASGDLGRRHTGSSAAATSAGAGSASRTPVDAGSAGASPTPLTAPSTGASGDLGGHHTGSSAAATSADLTRPFALAALRVGEPIVVIGRTLRGPAAIWGSVQLAGPAWSSRRGGRIDQRIELDVAFDPSFEGGAVIDMEGNIAAMAVPGPYHRVLGIPATTIEAVVSKVDKFGRLPKPYIGIRLQPLWLDDATRTRLGRKSRGIAAVGGVDAGSPAAVAHIELGDLLLALDGEPAESVTGLAQRIASTNPGQTIALEVLRGGKPLTINVRIAERPRI